MQTPRTVTAAAGAILAAAALAALSTPGLAASSQGRTIPAPVAPDPAWDTFSAELTIRQSVIAADGQPPGPAAPAVALRLERRLVQGRWQTAMTLKSLEPPQIRGLATGPAVINPFEVVRLEYDENGTPPRMYDRQGRLVRLPGEADRRRLHTPAALAAGLPVVESLAGRVRPAPQDLGGREWIAAVMAPRDQRPARQAALTRQFGPPSGQVRGHDRYLGWIGTDTLEVLVDRNEAVPVEINTVRNGALHARTTLDYARDAAGTLLRRTARAERDRGDGTGERTVTEVELAHLQAGMGGGE